jgi:hypothetical protein
MSAFNKGKSVWRNENKKSVRKSSEFPFSIFREIEAFLINVRLLSKIARLFKHIFSRLEAFLK